MGHWRWRIRDEAAQGAQGGARSGPLQTLRLGSGREAGPTTPMQAGRARAVLEALAERDAGMEKRHGMDVPPLHFFSGRVFRARFSSLRAVAGEGRAALKRVCLRDQRRQQAFC